MKPDIGDSPALSPSARFWRYWLPWLLWMLLIFILSHQDKDATQRTSGLFVWMVQLLGFSEAFIETYHVRLLLRKLAHFSIYLILFLWTQRVERQYVPYATWPWRSLLWCLLYAMSDEFHQIFVPGRGASVLDVLIDTSGAVVGWGLIRFYQKKYISRSVDHLL